MTLISTLGRHNKEFNMDLVTQLSPSYVKPKKVTGMPFFAATFLPRTN